MNVAYDVTRLVRRYAVPSPNGIDRIDIAYARHFIAGRNAANTGVYLHALQPALLDTKTLISLISEMDANWRTGQHDSPANYDSVRQRLLGRGDDTLAKALPSVKGENSFRALGRRLAPLRLLRPRGLCRAAFGRIPAGALFVHTTHYPLAHLFRWLRRRRDVKPVFFIHDLLPLQYPEYFAPAHIDEHRRALEVFAQYGRAAIVNTHVVERQVRDFLYSRDRRDVPVLVRPMPPDPVFGAALEADLDLADTPYFVVCGTIEPRKNHLTLLHVWRELSRQRGDRTPKLLVIGRRGWENENVVDLLDRSHEIGRHVIEIGGLPTASMARLMAGARALLMPSFAEGYGLPIVEARAVGIPVIASDIAVFREIAPEATFRAPLDGIGWLGAIRDHAAGNAPHFKVRRLPSPDTTSKYFADIEEFMRSL